MRYISVKEAAGKWDITPRVVRQYCEDGRVEGAFKTGATWNIPEDAVKPERKRPASGRTDMPDDLLARLRMEKESMMPGGIYHLIQIEFAYNSNHIEGSKLTHDQTRYIYETNTIGLEGETVNADDVIETVNHFRALDYIIDHARQHISESMIKKLHLILKTGTQDSRRSWFAVGAYKRLENEVGGMTTARPEDVPEKMKDLIRQYNMSDNKTLKDLLDFHYRFERIHPFQDGNGRVGRLILFKECLRTGVLPFIIEDDIKLFYYRGLAEWPRQKGYLIGTAESQQNKFKEILSYYHIRTD